MKEVNMPNLGMTMLEGKVVKWLVEDKANVEQGQEIVEVTSETGKLNKVLEAPISGTLSIKLAEDIMIEVGGVIGAVE